MKNNRVSGVREGANQDGKNTRTTSTDKSDESKQQRARCGACDGRARNPKQAAQSVLGPGDGSYEKPGVRSKLAASQRPDWCVRGDEAPICPFEQRAQSITMVRFARPALWALQARAVAATTAQVKN